MTVPKIECIECKKEANFYSKYDKEEVRFCSSECHDKYNEKADVPNLLLVKLDDGSPNDENISNTDEDENLSAIFKACRRGSENHEELFKLLENGEAANQKNAKGHTLMTYSITKGDLKTLNILLEAGGDVNEADGNSLTPLMVAASIEAEKKVAFLLQRDADVLLRDGEGKTALHKTETNKKSDVARLLLEKDPSVIDVKDNFEQTAVHVVAGEGNDVILAEFLEDNVTKLTGVDNLGRTPLHCSVIRKAERCVELLLNHKDASNIVDVADRFGFCPLHYAIQANCVSIVSMLIEKGCDIDKPDNNGQTGLLCAASCGYIDTCKIILTKSKKKDAVDSGGQSALHHAAAHGNVLMCELLIQSGADINLRDKQQQTCIYRAACNAKTDAVKMLVGNGAKCDDSVKDEDGRTPLHYVAEKGHEDVLKVLASCDQVTAKTGDEDKEKHVLNLLDNERESALYLAALHEHKECCQILIESGVVVDDKSRRFLVSMGLVEEQKPEPEPEPEEPGDTSPRNRYAADQEPPSDSEPVENLPIENVVDPEEVAHNSRHSTTSSSGSEKRRKARDLKARRVDQFAGNENSPYLQSMLTEKTLFNNQRYLGIRPSYLSRSGTDLNMKGRSRSDSIFSESNWSKSEKKSSGKNKSKAPPQQKKKLSYSRNNADTN